MEFLASPPAEVIDAEAIVRRHQRFLWTYLRMLGCGPEEAEDIAQEAFLVVLRQSPQPDNPRAFLKSTARLLWLNAQRRRAREPASRDWVDAVDAAWDRQVELDGDPWLAALRECRDQLDGRRHSAVALYYGERLGIAEVAKRLGMRRNGAKTLLQRLRADLRECIRRTVSR